MKWNWKKLAAGVDIAIMPSRIFFLFSTNLIA